MFITLFLDGRDLSFSAVDLVISAEKSIWLWGLPCITHEVAHDHLTFEGTEHPTGGRGGELGD